MLRNSFLFKERTKNQREATRLQKQAVGKYTEHSTEKKASADPVIVTGSSELMKECRKGHFDKVKKLLANGADPNFQDRVSLRSDLFCPWSIDVPKQ